MRRQECGSNAMVTVQMTVEEYLEMKSRQDAKAAYSSWSDITTERMNREAARPENLLVSGFRFLG